MACKHFRPVGVVWIQQCLLLYRLLSRRVCHFCHFGSRLFVVGGTSLLENLGGDTNANQAFKCSNTVVGKVKDPSGLGIGGATINVSGLTGLIGSVLTAVDGFYLIDLPTGGTYTVSATTPTGSVAATVNVPDGTIVTQNLSI
jgi:hypothetical protein